MSRSSDGSSTSGRPLAGIGRVYMWRWGSVWVSRNTGHVPPHVHHAIQITLAPAGSIGVRQAAGAAWERGRGSIVMPDRPHEFDGCAQRLVMIFVEPESILGGALIARFGHSPICIIEDTRVLDGASALLDDSARGANEARIVEQARQLVELLAGQDAVPARIDPRITAAIEWLRDRIEGLGGASWTEAAQASGFADSAHLTRTCRRMFGIAPSMLAPD